MRKLVLLSFIRQTFVLRDELNKENYPMFRGHSSPLTSTTAVVAKDSAITTFGMLLDPERGRFPRLTSVSPLHTTARGP